MKIFFAVPSYMGLVDEGGKPRCEPFMKSLVATIDLCEKAGHEVVPIEQSLLMGCCYIQVVRNELVKAFRDSKADVLFFLDDDMSWKPEDALKLIEMPDLIVAGAYRYKTDMEDYPIVIHSDDAGRANVRESDGAIHGSQVPTGFLRIRKEAIELLCVKHADRAYFKRENGAKREGYIDLFPQGLEDGQWVGEDYAFCRLWERMGGEIWVVPDMTLSHHGRGVEYSGNYHEYLMRQPTGSNAKPFDLSNCEVTQGWLTMFEAEFLAEQASTRKIVVEMGCAYGKSTLAMADNMAPDAVLYAVDNWYGPLEDGSMLEEERAGLYDKFCSNLSGHIASGKVVPIMCDHADILTAVIPEPDMVFIDGDHSYESAKRDIDFWYSKIKPGGMLCGHDAHWEEVEKAVKEVMPDAEFVAGTSIWAWTKPEKEK